ncbi:MAG TPA: tetratricopeptide repeat protein, partial [Bacteroidales bacterium]|nr:tetratricopeptide repeat protein [Bacteroidales bacterium]
MKKLLLIFLVTVSLTSFGQDTEDYNYQYALTEAARQKVIGNLQDAIILYKKCIDAKPESSVAYYELGSIYAALKEPDLAEDYLNKSYVRDPSNYWYVVAYDQILKRNGKDKEAIKICRKYLKEDKDSRILFNISESLVAMKKYKKAVKVLNSIEKRNGLSEMVSLKKVEIYKKWGKFDEGLSELMKLRGNMPEAPEFNILVAEYLEEGGRKDEAINYYKKAFELDSTNIYAITNLADYYNQNGFTEKGYYYLGKAFSLDQINVSKKLNTMMFFLKNDSLMNADSTRIGQLVQELVTKYPENYDINTVAYDFYNKTDQVNKAYTIIEKLLMLKTDNYVLYQQALFKASRLGKYDDIVKYGNEALRYFPNKPELKLFIGIALYQKGSYEKSLETLQSGYNPELNSGLKTQYLTFLGESAYRSGNYDDSFAYFDALLALDPDNLMIKNNYSYYMATAAIDLKKARKLSGETIQKDPENGTFLDTYGWILFKSGDYVQAKIYLEKAIKNSTGNSEISFHYAEVLYKLGDRDLALTWFEKARDEG